MARSIKQIHKNLTELNDIRIERKAIISKYKRELYRLRLKEKRIKLNNKIALLGGGLKGAFKAYFGISQKFNPSDSFLKCVKKTGNWSGAIIKVPS